MTPSRVDGVPVFDRKQARRFPESKERKQLIRDVIAPEKSLGCSEGEPRRKGGT